MTARRHLFINVGLLFAATLFSALSFEAAVRLFDLWAPERAATRSAKPTTRETVTGEQHRPATNAVVHPFLGWSERPQLTGPALAPSWVMGELREDWQRRGQRRNVFGFFSTVEDPRTLPEDDFVIAIFGGSVAFHAATLAGEVFVQRLEERRPELAGSIRVLNFATGGYKQPQQLFLLEQVLLLGVPVDMVINLDGFNEVALGAADAAEGRHPLFPHSANLFATTSFISSAPSAREIELTGDIHRHRRHAEQLRSSLQDSPWGLSATVRALVGRRILRAEERTLAAAQKLHKLPADSRSTALAELGDPCLGQGFRCWRLIREIWRRSSLAMYDATRRSGARFLHVLQPNQYVKGSKPLNAEERACCYKPERQWSRAASLGYPHLQAVGKELEASGVIFSDFTTLFADRRETLYQDACCHLNLRGNELLGRALADRVADSVDLSPREGAPSFGHGGGGQH